MFAQTISQDSLQYEKANRDSIVVDEFVKKITGSSMHGITQKIKNGITTYKADEKRIIIVEVYKDSVYFMYSYVPVVHENSMERATNTFYKASFLKRWGHWYYYCNQKDRARAIVGMKFIEAEIDDFAQQK